VRYTTPIFNEVANIFGKFAEARNPGEITVELYSSPNFDFQVPLTISGVTEISGSRAGGFATYFWPSSGIETPPALGDEIEYLCLMRDTLTTRTAEAKFVLGGHPDESALGRYEHQAHISPDGTALPTIASGTATCTFTSSGIVRLTGSWATDGFAAAVGNVIQIQGNGINRGIAPELVSIETTTNPNDTLNFFPAEPFTPEAGVTGVIVVAKRFIFPAGTDTSPVIGIYDGRQVAFELGLGEYHIHGGAALDVDFNHDNWVFTGNDQDLDSLTFVSGSSNEGARFSQLKIFGTLNGRVLCDNCILDDTFGVKGVFSNTALKDTITLASGGEFVGDKVASRSALSSITYFSAGGASSFLAGSVQGVFTITNLTAGDTVGMSLAGTILQQGPGCTGGIFQAIGYGEFSYTPGSGPTFIDQVLRGTRLDVEISSRPTASGIADQVWDEILSGHLAAGSTGAALASIASGVSGISGFGPPPTAAVIADQVWDEPATDHLTAGSTGRDQYDTRRHITNRRRVASGITPWTEIVYADDGSTVIQTAELKDLAGADITDSNAPAGTIIAERDPV